MNGERVWCFRDSDCREPVNIGNYCNMWGECVLGPPGGLQCNFGEQTGEYCWDKLGLICGFGGCELPCRSHADCPGGECLCQIINTCLYWYCGDGLQEDGTYECPGRTEEVPDTLLCEVTDLEGVCTNYSDACDPGYQRVGEHGCEPLFDCGNGIREVGEQCDGTDLGGANCESLSPYYFGVDLACNSSCGFDVTGCQ